MTRRICSMGLALLLLFTFSFGTFAAATFEKQTITAEKANIYEKASAKSEVLATLKKGDAFTPVAETKSYWKVEYKPKKTGEAITGYIRKKDTAAKAATSAAEKTESSSKAEKASKSMPSTVYWVPNGKSYHYTKDCVTLSRSKTILSGSFQESQDAKKYDPCNVCAGGK